MPWHLRPRSSKPHRLVVVVVVVVLLHQRLPVDHHPLQHQQPIARLCIHWRLPLPMLVEVEANGLRFIHWPLPLLEPMAEKDSRSQRHHLVPSHLEILSWPQFKGVSSSNRHQMQVVLLVLLGILSWPPFKAVSS